MKLDWLTLGMFLIIVGLGLAGLSWLLARRLTSKRHSYRVSQSILPMDVHQHGEAVLLALAGGKIVYLNQTAREWFEVADQPPNLEKLARRIHPSETFLALCAAQGQARFKLAGRIMEGISYKIPYEHKHALLVSIRHPLSARQPTNNENQAQPVDMPPQAFELFAEASQAMIASLDIEKTIEAILVNLDRLLPSDAVMVTLQDGERTFTPYHLKRAERLTEKGTPLAGTEGYTAWLVAQRKPLLLENAVEYAANHSIQPGWASSYLSYLGSPLLVAGEVVGTIELASFSAGVYTPDDLEILDILSGQAAAAIHNAQLYEAEQKRAMELSGLAQLAQVVGALSEPQELYTSLINSYAPLLPVKILGFLVYDENRRLLSGQIPFKGIQSNVIELTSLPVPPDSPAEQLLLQGKLIRADPAATDARLNTLQINHLAMAAGIQRAVLAPLASGGRYLGYLMVADRVDDAPFNQDDLRLISILAGQAAPMIENITLVRQARRRALVAETLRRIASLTGSSATLDEILNYSLLDLARLFQVDAAAVFLLDEQRNELRVHRSSLYGIDAETADHALRISTDDPQFHITASGGCQPYISFNLLEDTTLPVVYRPLVNALHLQTLAAIPLIVREQSLGEILLGGQSSNWFNRSDVQTINTAAGQLASAIERASLYSQTDESLRRRVDQLTALTRIGRELNATPELEYLLQRVYNEILQTTGADCGCILLFADNNPFLDRQEAQRIEVAVGDPPASELDYLEQVVLESGEPLIIGDFDEPIEYSFYHLSKHTESTLSKRSDRKVLPAHEGIRSALIVPITYQEQVAGMIHLHARSTYRFDETAREIAESLAVQAGIALGNAHRFRRQVERTEILKQRVETLTKIFENSHSLQLEQPLEQALENIAYAIQGATPFNKVIISLYESVNQGLQAVTSVGMTRSDQEDAGISFANWSDLQNHLQTQYAVGKAYLIPQAVEQTTPEDEPQNLNSSDITWRPGDKLLLPLFDASDQPLGVIQVDAPRDDRHPDQTIIETLEIFSTQAILVIESHARLRQLESQVGNLKQNLEQSFQTSTDLQAHLEDFLLKDEKNKQHLQQWNQLAQRVSAGLEIIEQVNKQANRAEALLTFGWQLLLRLNLDAGVIAEVDEGKLKLLHTVGGIPPDLHIDALIGQRNPMQQCSAPILVASRQNDSRWKNSPLLAALECGAFICLPVGAEAKPDAVVLLVSRQPLPPFLPQEEALYDLLRRQMSITLNNYQLMAETEERLSEVNLLLDFSRQLGSLEPTNILETLVNSVVRGLPSAQAARVYLWDGRQSLLVPQFAVGYSNNQAILDICTTSGHTFPGKVFANQQPTSLDEVDFASLYPLSGADLTSYQQATHGQLPVSTMAAPLQGAAQSDPLGVLVVENFSTAAAFKAEDLDLIASLARQTALTLENTRLYHAAEQRASQLQALTGVATTITSYLHPNDLVAALLDQLEAILPYETGTIWLRQGKQMFVREARGFVDNDQRLGLSVTIDESQLLNAMISSSAPLYVADVNQDDRFPAIVEEQPRSWLGLPLIASGEVTGVIALEKNEPNFYTPEHLQAAATFASQAAVALENARLYQESLARAAELAERSQRLAMLNRFSAELSQTLDEEQIFVFTLRELLQASACSGVSYLLFDQEGRAWLKAILPESSIDLPLLVPGAPLFDRLRQTQGIIHVEDVTLEEELKPLQPVLQGLGAASLLAVSLATGDQLHGILLLHTSQAYRFSPEEIELVRTIANQAAVAAQNARLYAETRSLSQDLEKRVQERTKELALEHQRTETLLRISNELTASLDLEHVLNRTIRVLNEIVDAEQIAVMILRAGESKLHHLASLGYAPAPPPRGKVSPFEADEGLAGWVIQSRQPVVIADVHQDPRWIQLPQESSDHRSAIGVPMMVGEEALGALLFYHREAGYFTTNKLDLIQAAANQVAVAVNNAELYRLIRDQAEDLGNMFRSQQIETSRQQAILEAVADGVLVTDASSQITLFNASAERILGLKRSKVLHKSLDQFIGLFGRAARSWTETIRRWSRDLNSFQPDDLYAEQIELEDGRVVSVHLAPVRLRDDFLGTVSIFRDITHQIELDRLKSEFVATVSHELRTPMTSIKGYVEVLLMGAAGLISDQQAHFLGIIKGNTERLAVLVNDLLDISRIEAGKAALTLQPLDIVELTHRALASLINRMQDENKSMQVGVKCSPDLPLVLGDMERVCQILDNLFENAYQYTDADGTIQVVVKALENEVQIEVADNGIGIPPELQARIFDRFYRGEHPYVLATYGTGLGLSMVKTLVEMHQGRIWVESTGVPGQGSQFLFTLPVYKTEKKIAGEMNVTALNPG